MGDDKRVKKVKKIIQIIVYEDGSTEIESGRDMQPAELSQIRPPNRDREST